MPGSMLIASHWSQKLRTSLSEVLLSPPKILVKVAFGVGVGPRTPGSIEGRGAPSISVLNSQSLTRRVSVSDTA